MGTANEPDKASAARRDIAEAGLSTFARVLDEDLRNTLPTIASPVDFVLIEIYAPLVYPASELLAPRPRRGDHYMRQYCTVP